MAKSSFDFASESDIVSFGVKLFLTSAISILFLSKLKSIFERSKAVSFDCKSEKFDLSV
ncbi:MAG: hypothetical protein VW646_00865 [Hydrogenophilales bacterium]